MSSYRMKYKIGATQYHIPVVDDMAGFGSGIPLGTILSYSANTLNPPEGFLFCDGSAISRAMYPDLFALIGTLYGSGDGSTTFNLPDLRGRVAQGASDTNPVGTYKTAGLPNITGSARTRDTSWLDETNALFTTTGAADVYPYTWSGSLSSRILHIDASRSSAIYGNSTTVQPPAACVNYIIKAFSATTSSSELIDITQYASALNQKYDTGSDWCYIYPNNGTAQNPASISIGTRYVESNPFPGYIVNCIAEVLFNNLWSEAPYAQWYYSDYKSYGVKAIHHNNDSIVVQTGVTRLLEHSSFTGNAYGENFPSTTNTSSLPCRIKVWKIGKLPTA